MEVGSFLDCSLDLAGRALLDSSFVLELGAGEALEETLKPESSVEELSSAVLLVRCLFLGGSASDTCKPLE